MAVTLDDKLVVAISSRALLTLKRKTAFSTPWTRAPTWNCSRRGWKCRPNRGGLPAREKLLAFNTAHARNVEVVILSRNDPVSALRIFARPKRQACPGAGVFTQGRDPFRYLRPLGRTCFCRPTSRT